MTGTLRLKLVGIGGTLIKLIVNYFPDHSMKLI